jgi:multiple antibiotic resistance protein
MRLVARRDPGITLARSGLCRNTGAEAVRGWAPGIAVAGRRRIVDISQRLSLGMYFTAFFVMLGPVKLIAPFAALTAGLELREARRLALKGVGAACVGGAVAAVMGQRALAAWGVSRATLLLAAGIVLFVVALRAVVAASAPSDASSLREAPPHPALSPLAVPLILTPYGVATLVLILAVTHDPQRQALVFGLFLVVMLLDLLAMWFARPIVRWGGGLLTLVGSVLGVLQVALALQLILEALGLLHVLPGSRAAGVDERRAERDAAAQDLGVEAMGTWLAYKVPPSERARWRTGTRVGASARLGPAAVVAWSASARDPRPGRRVPPCPGGVVAPQPEQGGTQTFPLPPQRWSGSQA